MGENMILEMGRHLADTTGQLDSEYLWIPVLSGFAMVFMAWGIGANDVANAFATSFGSGSLNIKQIVIIATFCEFGGALLLGSSVSATIRKGIVDIDSFPGDNGRLTIMVGMLSALLAGSFWLALASRYGLPVSTTHTIVGSVVGFIVVGKGYDAVKWSKIIKIVLSWVVSPLISLGVSGILWFLTKKFVWSASDDESRVSRAKLAIPPLTFLTFTVCIMFMIYKGGPALGMKETSLGEAIGWGAVFGAAFSIIAFFGVKAKIDQWTKESDDEFAAAAEEGDEAADASAVVKSANLDDALSKVKANPDTAKTVALASPATADDVGAPPAEELKNPMKRDENGKKLTANALLLERIFRPLNITTAAFESFAHGANDVANAIGPFNAVVAAYNEPLAKKVDMPLWILAVGGFGIVIGLHTYGKNVMYTLGRDITYITPARAFCIELGATFTILLATNMGMPVSTTHASVGAVMGIGLVDNWRKVKWNTMGKVFGSWIITLPVAGFVTAAIFGFLKPTVVEM